MIGYLSGTIKRSSERNLILVCQGVGYKILCPLPILLSSEEGKEKELYIHTHVREDAITLYGFEQETELETFEKLLSVSGIGPKSALAMLSVHSPASVADAIERGDAVILAHTPGLGKKTAEKIIIELKGKLTHLQGVHTTDAMFEVRLALESLGYSQKEIHDVLQKIDPLQKDTGKLIKQALSELR